MSNILLKILIVVALIIAWLVFYSYKLIHEKPIHEEERVVVKSVVMPHPPLHDKSRKQEEKALDEYNDTKESVEESEPNSTTVELTPAIPQEEIEGSTDEPEIVINDETEIIDDNNEDKELATQEEPPLVNSDEVEVIEDTSPEQIPVEEPRPNIDLGKRIGGDESKKENVDLGVQLF